jgi:hypothetical protein
MISITANRGDEFVSWDQQFFDPIKLPDGRKLVTLRDVAEFISALPEAEHALPALGDGD